MFLAALYDRPGPERSHIQINAMRFTLSSTSLYLLYVALSVLHLFPLYDCALINYLSGSLSLPHSPSPHSLSLSVSLPLCRTATLAFDQVNSVNVAIKQNFVSVSVCWFCFLFLFLVCFPVSSFDAHVSRPFGHAQHALLIPTAISLSIQPEQATTSPFPLPISPRHPRQATRAWFIKV